MEKHKQIVEETEMEQSNNSTKSARKIRISQRAIITLAAAMSVAVISFVVLMVLSVTTRNRNESEFEKNIDMCCDYIVHTVNSYNAADEDIDKAVGEIKSMAYSLSGRVFVIDNDYRIILDTYGRDTDRNVVDENVYMVMSGEKDFVVNRDDNMYEKIIPIVNSDGYVGSVAVVSVDTGILNDSADHMNKSISYLYSLAVILGIVAAFVVAKISVRDITRVKTKIEGMKGGSLEQMEPEGMFREMRELTLDINDIFHRTQILEDSRQEFVSNVSHELKTPITSMKVLSESLLTQNDVPAEMYREFMEDIVQEIDREAEIISDLLTLVKTDKGPDSLNKENVDMNEFMELILKRLKPLAEKRSIQLTFESFTDVQADIDKVKFTLAISNIIENGIKYNIEGGWIKVSLNSDHKNFYIKVADSGVGIPEDCINRIFERFYRVDKARSRDTGGTGLGLAITKNIILLHKGTINVYSEPGKGTTFTVRVPLGIQQ